MTITLPDLIIRPVLVEVESYTDPDRTYLVQVPHCTCPDFQYRDKQGDLHLCKHIQAVYAQVASWRAESGVMVRWLIAEVESFTTPGLTYTVHLPWCQCPDFRYRDRVGELHLCKHIVDVYAAHASWQTRAGAAS